MRTRIIAAAIVAALVAALLAWWHVSTVARAKASVRAEYASAILAAQRQAETAEQDLAKNERELRHEIEQIQTDAAIAQADRDSRLRDALDAADELRSAAASVPGKRPAPGTDTAIARCSPADAGREAGSVPAGLLDRHTGELVAVGGYAEEVMDAGARCEQAYNAARKKLQDLQDQILRGSP